MRHALIVDDEADIRELLEITLARMQLEVVSASTLGEARAALDEAEFDLCLTDMRLPDGSGIELVRHVHQNHPSTPVAMITAHGSMDSAVEALKAGAFDFVSKPLDLTVLRNLVTTALRLGDRGAAPRHGLIGRSRAMRDTRATIAKLSRSQAPVYISGESGTGKELAARMIHEQGPRGEGAFVPVNCGAIPGELMESELFGHKRGSFSGAVGDKRGLFQAAQGGTLFLDEVADLPLLMQVKLLRAIQEKAVRPVGSEHELAVDVRVLSASHKDLDQLVRRGQFRQDLYYRLNVINLHVPALRERAEDVPELAAHVLTRLAAQAGLSAPPELDGAALAALSDYPFPGNVRELENILERAMTLCEGTRIAAADLALPSAAAGPGVAPGAPAAAPAEGAEAEADADGDAGGGHGAAAPHGAAPAPAGVSAADLDTELESMEKARILKALEQSRWNKTQAARRLGISFGALRYRMQKLGLD